MSREWFANLRSPLSMGLYLGTTVIGLIIDLWTKYLAYAYLSANQVIEFIPGFVHFKYVENRGAVFGIGQGYRGLFIVVSLFAILFLTYLFLTSGRRRMYHLLLGVLLAGVLGNLYDRYFYGHVRDMIHALPRWDIFPYIFNVADMFLCVGVGAMLIYSFFQPAEPSRRQAVSAGAPSAHEA